MGESDEEIRNVSAGSCAGGGGVGGGSARAGHGGAHRAPVRHRHLRRRGLHDGLVHDARSERYLLSHLRAVSDAIAQCADVRGYLHWSLLDNFEWLEAWGPRFGLYRVDFETLERKPTAAVEYYRQVATSRKLEPP